MKPFFARWLPTLQLAPILTFLILAHAHEYSVDGWSLGFRWGAAIALAQFILLMPILRGQFSRVLAGVNLFLVIGGVAFFFNIFALIMIVGMLRGTLSLICVFLVAVLATIFSRHGAFSQQISPAGHERRYSLIFLLAIVIAMIWSFYFRQDSSTGFFLPSAFLLLAQWGLKKWAQRRDSFGALVEER